MSLGRDAAEQLGCETEGAVRGDFRTSCGGAEGRGFWFQEWSNEPEEKSGPCTVEEENEE